MPGIARLLRDRGNPSQILMYLSGLRRVGFGEGHAGGRDVVQLLAFAACWLGDVDDVQALGDAEEGDLNSAYGWG